MSVELQKRFGKMKGDKVIEVRDNQLCERVIADVIHVSLREGESYIEVMLEGDDGYTSMSDIYTFDRILSMFDMALGKIEDGHPMDGIIVGTLFKKIT